METHPLNKISSGALQIAVSQLGVKELPQNKGPKVKLYLASVGLSEGFSWCAAFVYWCFDQAAKELKITNPAVKTGGVLRHWQMTRGIKVKIPRPGDMFILDHGKGLGHTGFVRTVDLISKTYTTIEGNSNSTGSREGTEVCSNSRKISAAKGFIRY